MAAKKTAAIANVPASKKSKAIANVPSSKLRIVNEFSKAKGMTFQGRSKTLLSSIPSARHSWLEMAYKKVVSDIAQLTDEEAIAVCCAAVSENTWEAIVTASQETKSYSAAARLGERDKVRSTAIREQFGDDAATQFEQMLLYAKKATKGLLATSD